MGCRRVWAAVAGDQLCLANCLGWGLCTGAGACVVGDKSIYGTFDNFTETVLKPAILSYTPDDAMVATLTWPSSSRSTAGEPGRFHLGSGPF
jgi:hypothetical protein